MKYARIESVAKDVFAMERMNVSLGPLAEAGLASLHLYNNIFFTDNYLIEYLLAWYCMHQNTDKIISDTLKTFYQAQSWGNEVVQICVTVSSNILDSTLLFFLH